MKWNMRWKLVFLQRFSVCPRSRSAAKDAYLDAAEEEVQSFQSSVEEMQSFMACNQGFTGLAATLLCIWRMENEMETKMEMK